MLSEEVWYGKYQLVKKLAIGGMAELFLAKQPGPGGFEKTVVIKRILPHLARQDEFLQMFLNEARIAAHLTHPNIVQIHDIGQAEETFFIAMEYIRGQNVRRLQRKLFLQHLPPPYGHVAKIISEAATGLNFAHNATDEEGNPLQIIHRDVSPTNILVSYEGSVKIVDFGIAKAAIQTHQTRAGVVKGKYAYMSPEQVNAQILDRRADIFSLGTVLYELSTGQALFVRDNEASSIRAVLEEPIPLPSQIFEDYPPELEAVVMKALERDRNRRYQTAEEMHRDLESYLGSSGHYYNSLHLSYFMKTLFREEMERGTGSGIAAGLHSATPSGPSTPMSYAGVPKPSSPPPDSTGGSRSGSVSGPLAAEVTPTSGSLEPLRFDSSGEPWKNTPSGGDLGRQLSGDEHRSGSPSPPPPTSGRRDRLHLVLAALGGGLLLLLIGVAAYTLGLVRPGRLVQGDAGSPAPVTGTSPPDVVSVVRSARPHVAVASRALAGKRYWQAAAALKAARQQPDVMEFQPAITRIEVGIRVGPKVDVARSLASRGECKAAVKLLEEVTETAPWHAEAKGLISRCRAGAASSTTARRSAAVRRKRARRVAARDRGRARRALARARSRARRRSALRRKVRRSAKGSGRRVASTRRPAPARAAVKPAAAAAGPAPSGLLFVNSNPSGKVHVGGILRGYTPINGLTIPAGPHRIKISRRGFYPVSKTVKVVGGHRTEVEIELVPIRRRPKRPRKVARKAAPPKAAAPPKVPPRSKAPSRRKPRLPFARTSLPRRSDVQAYVSDPRGLVPRRATSSMSRVSRRIEGDLARLLGPGFKVAGVTRAWRRYVMRTATTDYVRVYPRAVARLAYRYLGQGRRVARVAQMLVAHQRRKRFGR